MHSTDLVDQAQLRTDHPEFGPGDTVKVHVRVVEGNRERTQIFEGYVIARRGSASANPLPFASQFWRRCRRAFPLHAPTVAEIERVAVGDVRRSKLYYLRDRIGKSARVKEERY